MPLALEPWCVDIIDMKVRDMMRKLIGSTAGVITVLAMVAGMLSAPSRAVGRSLTMADAVDTVTQSMRVKVKSEKVAEFEALMVQLMRDAANEPGVKVYEVMRVKDQPLTYAYFLSFENQAAFERYSAADWHVQAAPKILACLDGSPVIESLESLR